MQVTIMQGSVESRFLIGIEIGKLASLDRKVYYGLIAYTRESVNVQINYGWTLSSIDVNLNPHFNLSDLTKRACRHAGRDDVLTPATAENKQKFLAAYPELRKYIMKVKTCR